LKRGKIQLREAIRITLREIKNGTSSDISFYILIKRLVYKNVSASPKIVGGLLREMESRGEVKSYHAKSGKGWKLVSLQSPVAEAIGGKGGKKKT